MHVGLGAQSTPEGVDDVDEAGADVGIEIGRQFTDGLSCRLQEQLQK